MATSIVAEPSNEVISQIPAKSGHSESINDPEQATAALERHEPWKKVWTSVSDTVKGDRGFFQRILAASGGHVLKMNIPEQAKSHLADPAFITDVIRRGEPGRVFFDHIPESVKADPEVKAAIEESCRNEKQRLEQIMGKKTSDEASPLHPLTHPFR